MNRDVAVVGYAVTPAVRHADRSLAAITAQVALQAIADTGLQPSDIDGFTTGALFPSSSGRELREGVEFVSAGWLASSLGIRPRWTSGFDGYGQLSGAVMLATSALKAGMADYVLLHRALYNPQGAYHDNPMRIAVGETQWTAPHGLWGPPQQMALVYNEYLTRYGADRSALADVVTELRANGAQHPWSHWYKRPLTREQYLDAPMLSDPICLLDCDIPVTAAAAFVLTTRDRAVDLPHPPVYISGFGQGSPTARTSGAAWSLDAIMEGGAVTSERLWHSCELAPSEVDLPQLYDGFAPLVYLWLESLGFCGAGEAHEFVSGGGIASDTGLPVALSGGSLGNGRLHGLPQMIECYEQLSGRAGERQRRAEVALACHAMPHYGGVVVYTREPV